MKTYAEVFEKRGKSYDMAMQLQLGARSNEFQTLLKYADIKEGMKVGDIPSGGSYLTQYLNFYINLVCVEFTRSFHILQRESSIDIFCSHYNEIPLTKVLDRIVSLASLHHFENHPDFFKKMRTMLKPDGLLVIGDAMEDTPPAKFLNGFVNGGGQGRFADGGIVGRSRLANLKTINGSSTAATGSGTTTLNAPTTIHVHGAKDYDSFKRSESEMNAKTSANQTSQSRRLLGG